MNDQEIIKSMMENPSRLVLSKHNRMLYYDITLEKWVIWRGYGRNQQKPFFESEHFKEAFDVLISGIVPTLTL